MLKSMTGFGRSDIRDDGYSIQIQIKSVNHRYSDFTVKTPRLYSFLEDPIRSLASKEIARGKVEILLFIEKSEGTDTTVTLDRPLAEGYLNALRGLKEYGLCDDLTLSSMAGFRDIFRMQDSAIDEDAVTALVQKAFGLAAEEFTKMRLAEGDRLAKSLDAHLTALGHEVDAIAARSPQCIEAYRNRLRAKLAEVLADKKIDESRILTEAAIFADKIAVDEELVRLRSHMEAFRTATQSELPIGKKLDFIVQEMNREANTIGSKCSDLTVAAHVVEVKSLIEKIREQIQNIE